MNRKRSLIIITVVFSLILAFTFAALPGSALGDAGGFSGGSDYGGGFDSGGSSWGSGSDYSWGNDSNSYYDYDNNGVSSSSTTSSALETLIGSFLCIGFIIIVGVLMFRSFFASRKQANMPAGAAQTPESELRPVEDIKTSDPEFNQAALESKISNEYVRMQNAWTAKDFEPMRPFFTDALYTQFDGQLDQLRKAKQTNYVDNIAVLEVALRGWYETEENQCMVARVRTRIIDYTKDDHTGEIVSGSDKNEKFMVYEYILVRTKGSITHPQTEDTESKTCPHCGAPLNLNQSTKCPYCGSIIEAKDYDWVISSIKGISQQTVK